MGDALECCCEVVFRLGSSLISKRRRGTGPRLLTSTLDTSASTFTSRLPVWEHCLAIIHLFHSFIPRARSRKVLAIPLQSFLELRDIQNVPIHRPSTQQHTFQSQDHRLTIYTHRHAWPTPAHGTSATSAATHDRSDASPLQSQWSSWASINRSTTLRPTAETTLLQ